MPPPFCYDYPRPMVTVDLVVFALAPEGLRTLLIRRKKDPFAGILAIPGGFLEIDEPIEAAARRELEEETGLSGLAVVEEIGVFGAPGRDPRGRTISVAHAAVIPGSTPEVAGGDDADEALWADPADPGPLAFDHAGILARARAWLTAGVEDGRLVPATFPGPFTDAEARRLRRATAGTKAGEAAWLRRLIKTGRVVADGAQAGLYRRP